MSSETAILLICVRYLQSINACDLDGFWRRKVDYFRLNYMQSVFSERRLLTDSLTGDARWDIFALSLIGNNLSTDGKCLWYFVVFVMWIFAASLPDNFYSRCSKPVRQTMGNSFDQLIMCYLTAHKVCSNNSVHFTLIRQHSFTINNWCMDLRNLIRSASKPALNYSCSWVLSWMFMWPLTSMFFFWTFWWTVISSRETQQTQSLWLLNILSTISYSLSDQSQS